MCDVNTRKIQAPYYTDMRRLTTGMSSEKCVIGRFHRCVNVIECTYTNLDSIAYYTPSLYTGCNRRNGPNFGRVFLMLNYTDITQNTYVQS